MATIDPLDPSLRAVRTLQAPNHIQRTDEAPGWRVSSAAFTPGTDGTLSVDLEQSLLLAGLLVDATVNGVQRAAAKVAHTVGEYQHAMMDVSHDPVPHNPHHGQVRRGPGCAGKKKVARDLARSCKLIGDIDWNILGQYRSVAGT